MNMRTLVNGTTALRCPKCEYPMALVSNTQDSQIHVCDHCSTSISMPYGNTNRVALASFYRHPHNPTSTGEAASTPRRNY